eukprot:44592-Eustigmatos_ZCMA.PRE.1
MLMIVVDLTVKPHGTRVVHRWLRRMRQYLSCSPAEGVCSPAAACHDLDDGYLMPHVGVLHVLTISISGNLWETIRKNNIRHEWILSRATEVMSPRTQSHSCPLS